MDVALLPCWQDSRSIEANNVHVKDPLPPAIRRDKQVSFYRRTVKSGEPTIGQLWGQTTTEELLLRDEAIMPVATGSQSLLTSIPSFMSVFGDGLGARSLRDNGPPAVQPTRHTLGTGTRRASHNPAPTSYVYRRGSSGTFKSESSESSPTTTISTIDSTLTEPSPSSSPESPTLSLPLSSFSSLKTSPSTAEDSLMDQDSLPSSPTPQLSGFSSRADSPNKKMRNTKNLSLNTAGSNRQACSSPLPRPATSHTSNTMTSHVFSTPASPSFIVPPKAPKRKPSTLGLTITTPENSSTNPLHRSFSDIVPQTPSLDQLSTFNRMNSVTSLPVFSPTIAPEGGMQLPPFGAPTRPAKSRPALSLSQNASFDSSRSSPIVLQTLEHVPEENDDPPLSREIKSPAYPEGPVCIYQPNVYLYLEPSDTEASEFDVVINVAREVLNPFESRSKSAPETQFKDAGVQVNFTSEDTVFWKPDVSDESPSAASEKSFRSAFETQPEHVSSTILDVPLLANAIPEYVHIPWDHNTNVVDDLLRLCELIDNRVNQGKRVLVHCQCGVSRSASLIVAYGLFKNPDLTVQEAYDTVKERSRWIGPNMHLIYQLAEFKSTLSRKFPVAAATLRARRSIGLHRTHTDSMLKPYTKPLLQMPPRPDEPNTAPLQDDQGSSPHHSASLSPPNSAQHATPMSSGQVTPGPSSAPPDMQFSPTSPSVDFQDDSINMDIAVLPVSSSRMSSPRDMDISTDMNSPLQQNNLHSLSIQHPPKSTTPVSLVNPPLPGGFSSMSLRRAANAAASKEFPFRVDSSPKAQNSNNIRPFHISMDHIMADVIPSTPSILSPRAAEFTASPFHRTMAGDLAGSSVFEQGLANPMAMEKDPRSPPTGDEKVVRSIDEMI